MNFLENEIYIKNIFKIRDNIFNISKFNERKVRINNNCDVILIPSRYEIQDFGLKYDIWYSLDELKLMRTSYMYELGMISKLKSVTLNEAQIIWKQNN